MIDNMLKTRKIALTKRKQQGKSDMHNLTELWYEEFVKLHPEYKSSKKNLWRKYKWYKARMAEVKGEFNVIFFKDCQYHPNLHCCVREAG